MTFDASIPLSGDSPALFPSQSQTNFGRLQTIVSADHQFNASAAANDGYHNLIHMQLPNPLPTGALASLGRLYGKTASGVVQLHYMDSAGTEYQLTPKTTANIVAAVNFNGISGASIRGTALNVSSVVRNSTGVYTVNFTTPLANNNYIVQVTGMRNGSGSGISNGQILSSASYGSSVATTFVKVSFNGGSSSLDDVFMGNVIVYLPA